MIFKEKTLPIRGVMLSLKHWHENAPVRIIALHGWLDNAASFDVLAPLMIDCSIVAIDLAGQGLSDKRPPSATYHLWDDLLDVIAVADALGWSHFHLIGHSRGAMLSVMLAASCPNRVSSIMLIDGLMPQPVKIEDAPRQLSNFLSGMQSHATQNHRYFESREQAITVRSRASSLPEKITELLAARQVRQDKHGWYWNYDHRLKAASAIKLTEAHNDAFLKSVHCPVGLVLAKQGMARDNALIECLSLHVEINHCFLEGHHHLHMDEQSVEIARFFLSMIVVE